jgi:molybdopterin-guanine dinucleotide biosynthesis protein A
MNCAQRWAKQSQICCVGSVYHQRVNDLTAFVLAGGKSSRMGEDKAFLLLEGETLLSRALGVANSVTSNVHIVGDPIKFAKFGSVVKDIYPERGPLGGIHAALMSTQTDLNLMLAVDTPFVQNDFLDCIVQEARGCDAVVTLPRAGGNLHPLCAVYRREFAAAAEQSMLSGQNKIDLLFSKVKTKVIEETDLQRLGFCTEMFRNINTPEQWQEAQLRLDKKHVTETGNIVTRRN